MTKQVTPKTLEEMSLPELRREANVVFGIQVTKEMNERDIIAAIRNKQDRQNFVGRANSNAPQPGWARIVIHKDGRAGASNRPIYFSVNGYRITIPRGVEVDVPIKVVDGPLRDSLEMHIVEDPSEPMNSSSRFKREMAPSYPYNELMRTPGEDPRPGDIESRRAKTKPREDFRDKYGYWPSHIELKEAIKEGAIKLTSMKKPKPVETQADEE